MIFRFLRFSCGCRFLAWWNVFQLPLAQVESEGTRERSHLHECLYIYRNKRARSDRNYGRVCVKIVYASAVYLEFVPVSYLHVRIDDRPMKSFLSTRKLPTLLRWFIHVFCTRFIRRRLFLLLSVACHVGFVTRSLCEVHVIPRDDIYDSKKQQLILKLFRTVTLIVKKLFALKINVESI